MLNEDPDVNLTHLSAVGNDNFKKLSEHWATTSNQVPVCVVEPHSTDDVGKIVSLWNLTSVNFA